MLVCFVIYFVVYMVDVIRKFTFCLYVGLFGALVGVCVDGFCLVGLISDLVCFGLGDLGLMVTSKIG